MGGTWKRPAVTVIFVYIILMAYAPVPLLGLGLVASISEGWAGWEAIRVGSGLMNGRKFSGWVLAGFFVWVSGFINGKMEVLLENNEVGVWDKVVFVLMCWYALMVLLSYVATTVFYCDSRTRLDVKEFDVDEVEDDEDDCASSLSSV
uniref:Transmembrane protein n=1 Tax=Cajanus cajan TaxID=3821 RepID=A0A151R4D7_CAJCA|nr:hypothetical protein KK1_041380 [Cajanus cajan]